MTGEDENMLSVKSHTVNKKKVQDQINWIKQQQLSL
jgi:hypothetical protein